ncbi:MAG TPA: hypothetical protein VK484_06620, partial [Ferruginibacter sp.]|nr:hypothetical protein [Ferruginibacter sp.]
MQQDNNNIENKLRQLENQQLPDLSRMDEHWKSMEKNLIQTGNIVKSANSNSFIFNRKIFFWAASLVGIIGLIWLLVNGQADQQNKVEAAPTITKKALPEKSGNEAYTATDTLNNPPKGKRKEKNAFLNQVSSSTGKDEISAMFSEGNPNVEIDSIPVINTNRSVDPKKLVNDFYEGLKKQGEQFTVNSDKSADITCIEGTRLLVPAFAFVDQEGNNIQGEVKITVLEYYKYADIIAANLTTSSRGKQLITGGMVRITAEMNGRAVNLRTDKDIKLFMPTKNYDDAMQLFVSETELNKAGVSQTMDTIAAGSASPVRARNINWIQSGSQSSMPVFDGTTKFLNMQDEPYRIIAGRKFIAKFAIPRDMSLTTAEVRKILTEKYGDSYDRIKIRRVRWVEKSPGITSVDMEVKSRIGDSVFLTLDQALRWKYIDRKDSAFYAERIKRDSINFFKRFFANRLLGNALQVRRTLFNGQVIMVKEKKVLSMSQDSLDKYYE